MAGTLKVGGKVLATHNSETDEVSLASDTKFSSGTPIKIAYQSYTTSTPIAANGNTFTASGLNKDFSISSANNQILIFGYVTVNHGYTADNSFKLEILADSTPIFTEPSTSEYGNGDGNESYTFKMYFNFLYSPNTTASTNYSISVSSSSGATAQPSSVPSTMTIMEISG